MNHRRFAAPTPTFASPFTPSLADQLQGERLPLDLALSLAVEVVDAVATAHLQKRAFGHLTASDLVVQADGSIGIVSPSVPGSDSPQGTHAVGAVLYQVFTGLTPNQAKARLSVSPLHAVPPPSLLNPALVDGIDDLLSRMLHQDPARRPHSLRVVEAMLADICDELELDPSRADIVRFSTARVRAAAPVVTHRPPLSLVRDDEEDLLDDDDTDTAETEVPGPLRFDLWAAAACAFTVIAFTMATHL